MVRLLLVTAHGSEGDTHDIRRTLHVDVRHRLFVLVEQLERPHLDALVSDIEQRSWGELRTQPALERNRQLDRLAESAGARHPQLGSITGAVLQDHHPPLARRRLLHQGIAPPEQTPIERVEVGAIDRDRPRAGEPQARGQAGRQTTRTRLRRREPPLAGCGHRMMLARPTVTSSSLPHSTTGTGEKFLVARRGRTFTTSSVDRLLRRGLEHQMSLGTVEVN